MQIKQTSSKASITWNSLNCTFFNPLTSNKNTSIHFPILAHKLNEHHELNTRVGYTTERKNALFCIIDQFQSSRALRKQIFRMQPGSKGAQIFISRWNFCRTAPSGSVGERDYLKQKRSRCECGSHQRVRRRWLRERCGGVWEGQNEALGAGGRVHYNSGTKSRRDTRWVGIMLAAQWDPD